MDSAKLARRVLAAHGLPWAGMAADGRIGRVRKHGARWRLDFGRRWGPRFLYSFRRIQLETEEIARAILAHVERELARGRSLADVLDEASGAASSDVGPLLDAWIKGFERRVERGDRAPRTLREYKRWAAEGGDFDPWRGRTLGEIDTAALEEWDHSLFKRGLSPKTRRNVLAGFHAFLRWVAKQRPGYVAPEFPWPEVDEAHPTILTPELQARVLLTIPEDERGIFMAMAETLIRPSEARVLRVRDWVTGTNEIRVGRAAKDQRVNGEVRGLKARNAKTVPILSFELFDWLARHVPKERRAAAPDGPLFVNPDGRNGGWWSVWALDYAWKQACERAGVSGVTLYAGLKHSTATHLKALGADDRVLAKLAGHRDPRSVAFYAKLDASTVRNAIHRLKRDRTPD